MLALAIVLTIVSSVMLLTALALGLYIIWVKVREFHRNEVAPAGRGKSRMASAARSSRRQRRRRRQLRQGDGAPAGGSERRVIS